MATYTSRDRAEGRRLRQGLDGNKLAIRRLVVDIQAAEVMLDSVLP